MTNNNFGKLYIKKRTLAEWMTNYIFVLPFLLAFLLAFLGLPSFLKYTIDVAWVAVFISLFVRRRVLLDKKIVPFAIFIGISFLYVLTVYLFHFQSPFYFLWGVRNNYRFYIAFLAFAVFFKEDDAHSCLKLLDILFWINAVVSFVQFFFLGYQQDFLGGLFGVEKGCNAYSMIFFGLVLSKSVLSYMNGQEKALPCFLKCGVALIISALAELKFFFVIFVLIFAMAAFLTKFSWRKFVLIFIAAILFMVASSILPVLFGESSNVTFERVWELITTSNYATAEDLGRLTAIPIISETILTDSPGRLFGMGLGNCDTSAFAICNTPFYQSHADLNYTWFSSAFLFLETGYIGLIAYISFFVICFVLTFKRMKNGGNLLFCQIGMIFSVLCVIFTFYNSSLRAETGYMAYFALALPFIGTRTEKT